MRRAGPVLLLLAYGGAFAARAFGSGLPAFDDHPGQFFRLWHALERSVPDGRWTADWNPDWWGGYPELAFYPPGFALAGVLIRLLGLWLLPVETVYQLLCVAVTLLPAVTTFILVRRLVEDGWLALPPAFLALTLSAGLRGGVEESLRWGILTSRLALGLLPLLALSLRPWLDAGRLPVWAPVAAAALVLAHPAAAPVGVVMLVIAGGLALALRPRRETLGQALAIAALGLALSAFWTLPFLVRQRWVVPLAWGEADLGRVLGQLASQPLLVLVGNAALLAWIPLLVRPRPFDALVALLPLGLLGALAADAGLFRLGWSSIEPARFADGLVLALLWAGGLGTGFVLARLTAPRRAMGLRPVIALGIIGAMTLGAGAARSEPTLTLWPTDRAGRWPTLEEVSRRHDLPRLWDALRGTPDRVLFLASALRLDADPAWYAPHSHVLSLTPLLAGREIVHGTYTHPSPLAARFYTGAASAPPRIGELAERLDGQRLLGQPLERLAPEAFEALARRLRIATVVVPSADAGRVGFLRERYAPVRTAAGFTVFDRRDRPWPRLERITHRRYRVLVPPTGGVWVPTGIPAYPAWQAKSSRGTLPTRADPWGLLELQVPIDLFEAELVYGEGALEWAALGITLVGVAGWAGWARKGRGAGSGPRGAGSGPRADGARSALARRRRR